VQPSQTRGRHNSAPEPSSNPLLVFILAARKRLKKQPMSGARGTARTDPPWAVDEYPRNLRTFGQLGGECFDPESFSGIMAAKKRILLSFFSRYRCPMRRFARDQRVDFFLSDL